MGGFSFVFLPLQKNMGDFDIDCVAEHANVEGTLRPAGGECWEHLLAHYSLVERLNSPCTHMQTLAGS